MKTLSKLYKFFSSVKTAIFLLIAIAVVLMIGTFINQGDTISQYKVLFGVKVFKVLYWLGFLNIYDSWYFIGLTILLIISLITASINTFPRTIKAVFGPYPSFKEALDKKNPKAAYESFESKKDAENIIKTLNSQLGAPLTFRDGGKPDEKELYYSKNSIFRFSYLISHASIIIIIIGVLLNLRYGFRSYINIKVGEKKNVSHLLKNNQPIKLPFTIRLDKYQTKYYPDGIPKSYISTISIIKKHVRVVTKTIMVNHPLTYGGITMYQASYGHYKPTAVSFLVLNLKNRSYKKVINAQPNTFYNLGKNNIRFKLIPLLHPKKFKIPFVIHLYGNKNKSPFRELKFNFMPYKNHNQKVPLIFAKYKNIVFLYNGIKTYYFSGLEITKNSYTSIVWIGSIILIISLFFSFFFNNEQVWVSLTTSTDGKKNKVQILAVPKKKFESFYKHFNKKMSAIKKNLE